MDGRDAVRRPTASTAAPARLKLATARRSVLLSSVLRQERPVGGPGKDKSGPGQQREGRVVAGGPEIPLEPDRQQRSPRRPAGRSASPSPSRWRQAPQASAARRRFLPRAHTSPDTAIAGPMTFRMSTRNSVTGELPGLMMNAWSRKRNARMKISAPRRTTASAPALRRPVFVRTRSAESTRPSPASHRNSGAAKPPRTRR